MSAFKLYECDVGVKIGGVYYDFPHVGDVQVEDNERNQLTRGANATDKMGLPYKDGLKDPKRWTMTLMDLSAELKSVLDSAWLDQTRVDVTVISRKSGESKMLKNAIISNQPKQTTLDETPDSMNVPVEFVSYECVENLK